MESAGDQLPSARDRSRSEWLGEFLRPGWRIDVFAVSCDDVSLVIARAIARSNLRHGVEHKRY